MTAGQDALARKRSGITEELAAGILEHLVEQGLPAGSHIPAQELADRFNVSRAPVTDALRLLAQKGAVRHERNRGFFATEALERPEQLGLTRETALTRAYFQIAEDRLDGLLEDQVSETFLRQRYGLTRNQLAELLNRMSQEGWIERRPGYGWQFSPVLTTPAALLQTYRLRLAIEPAGLLEPGYALTRDVAERIAATERRMLAGAIDTMTADELYERGVSFHEILCAASGNPFFLDCLKRVNRVRRLLAYRSMVDRRRYYVQAEEHLHIVELLMKERNEEAAAAMHDHLNTVVRNLGTIENLLVSRPK